MKVNPLNATGANIHQVPMLTNNFGIERVNVFCLIIHSLTVIVNAMMKAQKNRQTKIGDTA